MTTVDYIEQTTPPTLKFALVRGDTLLETLRVSKVGFDFTGTTARCQVKKSKKASTILFTIVPLLTFPVLGQMTCTLRVEYAETDDWQPVTYFSDVELTLPGNVRKTVAFLEIEVGQDVST